MSLFSLTLLTGCFSDDSTLGDTYVSDISISGIEESYTKTAFVGEYLNISPVVETDYADMDYQWLLLDSKTGETDADGDTIQPTVIGTAKDLNYEVAIAPGTYQVRFCVRSQSNGYTAYEKTTLVVQTNFTQGFYILKATADGNTEVDMMNIEGSLGENIMTGVKGAPLQGAPVNLGITYNMYYVNPDNDEMEATNAVVVTTDKGIIDVSRTTDMLTIFDRSSLLFDEMDDSEIPYGITLTEMAGQMYFSSKGLRTCTAAGLYGSPNTGKFGMPTSECGASQYYCHDVASYGGCFLWDETNHSLLAVDYNGISSPLLYEDFSGEEETQNLTSYKCLHCGYNYLSKEATPTFILEDTSTGDRYLYLCASSFFGQNLTSRTKISSSLHLAKATSFSTNASSAKYIYCVEGNKVYACVFNSDELSEVEIQLQGIGSGETISYIGNQYWDSAYMESDPFNYLIVGTTTSGGSYKLYFYNMVGGAPDGEAVFTVEGSGTVKTVKYLSPSFDTANWMFSYPSFSINN